MPSIETLRDRARTVFRKTPQPVAGQRPFSVFVNEDVSEALQLASEMADRLRSGGDGEAGLDAALTHAEQSLTNKRVDLVKHALRIFITDNRPARELQVPPIYEIKPAMLLPSHAAVSPNDFV